VSGGVYQVLWGSLKGKQKTQSFQIFFHKVRVGGVLGKAQQKKRWGIKEAKHQERQFIRKGIENANEVTAKGRR